jgi:regulator of nonsense transcripts 2
LYLPLPALPTISQKSDSIQIGVNASSAQAGDETNENLAVSGGKWEDEEERRFYEDIQDLKDFVPKSVLGIEENEEAQKASEEEREKLEKVKADEEARKLEEELEGLKLSEGTGGVLNGNATSGVEVEEHGVENAEDE